MAIKKPKPTIKNDLSAIFKFLEESNYDQKNIIRLLNQFKILTVREKEIKDEKEKKNIITAQIRLFERVLKIYEMYELDVDISAERIKNIARILTKKAEKLGASEETLKKIKTEEQWTFDW